MRTLITLLALTVAGAALAEPKALPKPVATKIAPLADATPVVVPKSIEIAAPSIEIQTRDVAAPDLDKRLAAKSARKANASEAAMLRAPSKPNLPNQDVGAQDANAKATR